MHPIHKDLGATNTNTILLTFSTNRFYKKIKQKGRKDNYNVAFLQANELTIRTFCGPEATIITLHNSPAPLRSLVPFSSEHKNFTGVSTTQTNILKCVNKNYYTALLYSAWFSEMEFQTVWLWKQTCSSQYSKWHKPHSFDSLTRSSSATLELVNKNRAYAFSMISFPFGLFLSGGKQYWLVWYASIPSIVQQIRN